MAESIKRIRGNIADVVARKIFFGEIAVSNGRIVSIETLGTGVPEEHAPYILPGFVDSHIHIESTLMVPRNYARMAVANGVVAAVCDPHEIANVLGTEGVDFMIADGQGVRFGFNFMAPSCVPSTAFETSGAEIGAVEVKALLAREDIIGLAEMMNVPGVVYGDKEVMAKLQAAKDAGKPVDGHAPKATTDILRKYIDAGISTDHECITLDEAREKISMGMKVIIREGSAACDFESLYPLIGEYPGKVLFCSDDMYPDDIEGIGYINGMVRRAIAKGMPLWETLECASVTPARHYGLKNGLLQEGDRADFIIVDNLREFTILSTYVQGEEVYDSERGVTDRLICTDIKSLGSLNKFNAKEITPDTLQVPWESSQLKVMTAAEGSLLTGIELAEPQKDEKGKVITDVKGGISKIVVYNRYTESVPQVAYIMGFGLKKGALASTIAHDSHNIIAVGADDEAIAEVMNCLIREKGGIAVSDGERVGILPLPVAGLMTLGQPHEVAEKHKELKKMSGSIGCPFKAPFMTLAFMALPVIPDLKITDKGLFDGRTFCFTSVWEK